MEESRSTQALIPLDRAEAIVEEIRNEYRAEIDRLFTEIDLLTSEVLRLRKQRPEENN